tara:strand:- start:492 stop:1046 length:555 start_codon:yes stop_codon:yes gene_type:complete
MLEHQKRSKLFAFSLQAQDAFGKAMGLTILWSIWALFFSNIDPIFISNIILSALCLGLALIAPLIDFNESHATNPLWTGHARFHLVWQVNALAASGILVLFLLWIIPSSMNLLISIVILYVWLLSFMFALLFMPIYDGKLNDVNGVPPIKISLINKQIEIDRNVQAISGGLILCTYASLIIFYN